jgi:hypothetical protein
MGQRRPPFAVAVCLPFGEQGLGRLGLALQPGQPRLLIHAGHLLTSRQPPAASRWRMTAMSWRLAAAFWASTQPGSNSRLSRISDRVMGG